MSKRSGGINIPDSSALGGTNLECEVKPQGQIDQRKGRRESRNMLTWMNTWLWQRWHWRVGKEWPFQYVVLGLPWWRSGWESAYQCRGHGFEPWSGKIPHAAEQLGPWATITEPACLEPVLCNKRGHDNERPAHRDEEWPPLAATRESPHTETKTQHSHK